MLLQRLIMTRTIGYSRKLRRCDEFGVTWIPYHSLEEEQVAGSCQGFCVIASEINAIEEKRKCLYHCHLFHIRHASPRLELDGTYFVSEATVDGPWSIVYCQRFAVFDYGVMQFNLDEG